MQILLQDTDSAHCLYLIESGSQGYIVTSLCIFHDSRCNYLLQLVLTKGSGCLCRIILSLISSLQSFHVAKFNDFVDLNNLF